MGAPQQGYNSSQSQQGMQVPGYNLSNIYAPVTAAPPVFSQQTLNSQLPNVQYSQPNSFQNMMNSFLQGQGPLGMPQGSPQGQQQGGPGGLNNMMSFLGNTFGSGGIASGIGDAASGAASGIGDALSSAGGSILSLFGL